MNRTIIFGTVAVALFLGTGTAAAMNDTNATGGTGSIAVTTNGGPTALDCQAQVGGGAWQHYHVAKYGSGSTVFSGLSPGLYNVTWTCVIPHKAHFGNTITGVRVAGQVPTGSF